MTAVELNSQRKNYLKTLPRRCLDPMKRVEALIATIVECRRLHYAYGGDVDFEFAREATISLIQRTSRLHNLQIWNEVDRPLRKDSTETHDDDTDWIALMSRDVDMLRDSQCNFKDIEQAVGDVEKCIRHLHDRFVRCRVPKEGLTPKGIIERYKCAAMLPRMLTLLGEREWHHNYGTFNYG